MGAHEQQMRQSMFRQMLNDALPAAAPSWQALYRGFDQKEFKYTIPLLEQAYGAAYRETLDTLVDQSDLLRTMRAAMEAEQESGADLSDHLAQIDMALSEMKWEHRKYLPSEATTGRPEQEECGLIRTRTGNRLDAHTAGKYNQLYSLKQTLAHVAARKVTDRMRLVAGSAKIHLQARGRRMLGGLLEQNGEAAQAAGEPSFDPVNQMLEKQIATALSEVLPCEEKAAKTALDAFLKNFEAKLDKIIGTVPERAAAPAAGV